MPGGEASASTITATAATTGASSRRQRRRENRHDRQARAERAPHPPSPLRPSTEDSDAAKIDKLKRKLNLSIASQAANAAKVRRLESQCVFQLRQLAATQKNVTECMLIVGGFDPAMDHEARVAIIEKHMKETLNIKVRDNQDFDTREAQTWRSRITQTRRISYDSTVKRAMIEHTQACTNGKIMTANNKRLYMDS